MVEFAKPRFIPSTRTPDDRTGRYLLQVCRNLHSWRSGAEIPLKCPICKIKMNNYVTPKEPRIDEETIPWGEGRDLHWHGSKFLGATRRGEELKPKKVKGNRPEKYQSHLPMSKSLIQSTLADAKGSARKAAAALHIPLSIMYNRMKKYGLRKCDRV